VSATQQLGRRIHNDRAPMHDHVGPRVPRWSHHQISSPDMDGWQEVLPHSTNKSDGATSMARSAPPPRPLHCLQRIPDEMRDNCLNCLSPNHRIATYHRPLQCLHCHGYRHFARDCKRPRSPANGGSRNAAPDWFVRARRNSKNVDTLEGSQTSDMMMPDNLTTDDTPIGS
jgi:hypothetical protein